MTLTDTQPLETVTTQPEKSERVPTPREINEGLAAAAFVRANDSMNPNRIEDIRKAHFYQRVAAEQSTDEMRQERAQK